MLTFLIFLAILALLVLVHEAGHFFVARRAGVKVEEFGFGFPPRIFGFKRGETIYSINLIPLGGFVKIYGEDGEGKDNPQSFASKKALTRAKILIAGVTMNFLLAAVLLSLGNYIGLPTIIDGQTGVNIKDAKIQIIGVSPRSPAEEAIVIIGDTIRSARLKSDSASALDIHEVSDLQNFVASHRGEAIILKIERGKEILEKEITPRKEEVRNEGPLGVMLAKTAIVKSLWYLAPYLGIKSAFELAGFFLYSFYEIIKNLIVKNVLVGDVAGPVGIIAMTAQAARLGFIYILQSQR